MSRQRKPRPILYPKDVNASPEWLLQMALQGDFSKWNHEDRTILEAIPAQERASFLKERYAARLEDCHRALTDLLASVEPHNLLALLAAVGQLRLGETGEPPIGHVHLEIAQFLAVKYAKAENKPNPSIELYGRIAHLIREYHFYAALARSPAFREEDPLDESLRRR